MIEAETSREEQFVARIERLDSGRLAMLRRGCGERDPVEGRCPWLIGLIGGAAPEPAAFLVASLVAQYKTADIRTGHHRLNGNFGLTWKRAITGNDSESIKRRFSVLLDSGYDPQSGEGDLPYRLRQMVRYSANKGIGIDWPALLTHVRGWNSANKWVQKEWARAFFASERPDDAETSSEEKE